MQAKLKPITDDELSSEYELITERIIDKIEHPIELPNVSKNEHSFDTYERMQRIWDKRKKIAEKTLGRKPQDSLMANGERYRERIERRMIHDIHMSSGEREGTLNWYLNLRVSNFSNEKRKYQLPMYGLSMNFLIPDKRDFERIIRQKSTTNISNEDNKDIILEVILNYNLGNRT